MTTQHETSDLINLIRAILASGSWHDDGTWVYEPPSDDPLSKLEALMEARAAG